MTSDWVLAGAQRLLESCLADAPPGRALPRAAVRRRAPHSIGGQAERLLVGIARDLDPSWTPRVAWVGADEPPLVVEDVRDERIDVFAQNALLRITRDPASGSDARDMVDAVRSGRLLGIYKEDELVPAKRAQKLGTWWGTIIPKGEDSTVFLDPDDLRNGVPLIMFRDSVRSNKPRIDAALRKSLADFKAFEVAKADPTQKVDVSLPGCPVGESTIAGFDIVGQDAPALLRGLVPAVLCALKLPAPPAPRPRPAGPARLTIQLQMRFSLASAPGEGRFGPANIPNATVSVRGTTLSGVTDRNGRVSFATAGLIGRDRVLRIEPAADELSPAPAGLDHGRSKRPPAFMFRPFEVTVSVNERGFGTPTVNAFRVRGSPPHALVFEANRSTLVLDWKPDWSSTVNRRAIKDKENRFLVIHQTGEPERVGNHINTFRAASERRSAHYLIDVDGHVIKLVHESDAALHAGPSFFDGQTSLNARSLGIEIVHCDNTGGLCNLGPHAFTNEQYTSLLRLVGAIRGRFGITRQHVVGHGEINTESSTNLALDTKRITDPGPQLEWERLEAAGHARRRRASRRIPADVHGLKPGDKATRRTVPKDVDIAAIKEDLKTIGYSIHPRDGVTITKTFNVTLENTVQAFQTRYFNATRPLDPKLVPGTIDFATALAIREVAADTGR